MEEQKKTKKPADKAQQKLTYDELNNACAELFQQNQQLTQQNQQLIRQMNLLNNAYKRLDCLFTVLRYENVIKDAEFVNSCVDEIKELMTLPKQPKGEAPSPSPESES